MVHTSNELLATYPISRFRPPGYYPITTHDTDQESINSNMTEIYWPIDLDKTQDQSLAENKSCNTPHLKDNKTAKFKFNILLHGMHRRKPRYYFKCKEIGCTHTFATLKGWNLHHRPHHNTLIKCANCNKMFTTPSAHRAHKNLHAPLKYVCGTCGNAFPYNSTLRVHRHVHTSQCLFCCFAGSCTKQYKWPQDLHRHVTKHLNKSLQCTFCTYTTTEKRLSNQHKLVHDEWPEVYPFHCSGCDYRSKYYSPYHKHLCSCKGK